MAKDLNYIEMEFESKLLALENEVLLESVPIKNRPKRYNYTSLTSDANAAASGAAIKQIPRILRKPSTPSPSPRSPMCPLPNNAAAVSVVKPAPLPSILMAPSNSTHPIKVIPVPPQGVKYLVPQKVSNEPIRILVPAGNSFTPLSSLTPNSSAIPGTRPVKVVVKGTNSMRVVNGDSAPRFAASSLPRKELAVLRNNRVLQMNAKSMPNKEFPPVSNFQMTPVIPGSSSSHQPFVIKVEKMQHQQSVVHHQQNVLHHQQSVVHHSTINTTSPQGIQHHHILLVQQPQHQHLPTPQIVVQTPPMPPLPIEEKKKDPPPIIIPPPEPKVEVSPISKPKAPKANISCTRREMLAQLHSKQQVIFDSIYSKHSPDLNPSSYFDLYKKFSGVLKKLVWIRSLIHKYEGSSAPIPRFLDSNQGSPEDESYVKELREELNLFGVKAIGRLFHLRHPQHDFLTVMLSALESKQSRSFFCRSCLGKFKDFLTYMKHLMSKHPVLLRCIYCGDVFISALELKDHVKSTSHGYCKPCDRIFSEYEEYFSHVQSEHSSSSTSTKSKLPAISMGQTLDSSEVAHYRHDIIAHMRKYHPQNDCFVCSTPACKLSFESLDKLYEHYSANHIALICKFCSVEGGTGEFMYCSELEFFAHCKLAGHVFCPICEVLLAKSDLLEPHMVGVHASSPDTFKPMMETYPTIIQTSRCQACGYNSVYESEVERHIIAMSSMSINLLNSSSDHLFSQHKSLICADCGKVQLKGKECLHGFSSKASKSSNLNRPFSSEIKIKLNNVTANASYRIDKDNNRFLYSMTRSEFLNKILGPLKEDCLGKKLRCLTCLATFDTQKDLSSHVNEVHQEYSCKECPFVSRGKNVYDQHVEISHTCTIKIENVSSSPDIKIVNSSTANKNSFVSCKLCKGDKSMFPNKEAFADHVVENQESHGSYICPICVSVFISPERRNNHVRHNHNDYICHLCPNDPQVCSVFGNKSLMVEHFYKTHKDLICDKCPRNKFFVPKVNDENSSMPPMFVSTVNHKTQKHMGESVRGDMFFTTSCGLCPNGLNYFSFRKLLLHMHDRHPTLITCDLCFDLPIFTTKEDLFHHFKLRDHYTCLYCLKGAAANVQFGSWSQFQYHLKVSHSIVFCWNCETISDSLKGHRLICSLCDAVHCLPSVNHSHTCTKADIDLKFINCEKSNTSRHKTIDRFFIDKSSSSPRISTTKLRLLLEYIFKTEFRHFWFGNKEGGWMDKKDLLSSEEGMDILMEATNSPTPSEYLLKVWRDLSSVLPERFFTPAVEVKMEIELDPSSLMSGEEEGGEINPPPLQEEQSVLQEEEEDVSPPQAVVDPLEDFVIKEEILEDMDLGSPHLVVNDYMLGEDAVKEEEDSESLNDSKEEDDSALLEDIEDILESTHKESSPPPPPRKEEEVSKRRKPKNNTPSSVDNRVVMRRAPSLRTAARKSSESLMKQPKSSEVLLKRKFEKTTDMTLRKRTKTS